MTTELESITDDEQSARPARRVDWRRVMLRGLLPALALLLGVTAGVLNWQLSQDRQSATAATEAVAAAKDTTVAMLTYTPKTAERDLGAARDRLTGAFRDSYDDLVNDVVIPGAKEKNISTVAMVPAAAWVSATPQRAVVLLFVNQSVSIGDDPPTMSSSSVRVTLDKIDNRWLISGFDPV